MKTKINRIISFLKLLGSRNYYLGLQQPTVWQWLYAWRIGIKTAWEVSGIIWKG